MQMKIKSVATFVLSVFSFCVLSGCPGGGVKIGLPPPPLNLERIGGGKIDIKELKGKVILVNFWATWCAPCVSEMPEFEKLHRELEGRPFAVLAVSVDKNASTVEKFAGKNNLSFPILIDQGEAVARSWGTTGLPETFIIDREGNVAYKIIGPIEYESIRRKIGTLLTEK